MRSETVLGQEGRRVAFITLGCKVNQAESDAIASALPANLVSGDVADADVVVVNTCTVTHEADHKARKAVRHALRLPRRPEVIVTGCLAAIDAEGVRSLGDRVVVEPDKNRVRDRIVALVPAGSGRAGNGSAQVRARAQLKVQDGCDARCAYCIIPQARGLPQAVPVEEIAAEAERLVSRGASEIVLSGINIGCYEHRGAGLVDVLEAVAATGVCRIRLSSIEPGHIDDGLLDAMRRIPAFCRHLHIPLQSGSDSVLARMGRPYDTARFRALIDAVRSALPGVAVTTDVIAGFPGETDQEHSETLAFIEEAGFARLHVFRFSARRGTAAASMDHQVPPPLRSERAAELRSLGERLGRQAALAREGSLAEMLVERILPQHSGQLRLVEGTTREYERVVAACDQGAPGMLLRVRLGALDAAGRVLGMVESK